jgi:hypothetical protein
MRLLDAYILARTKRKTRRIRTALVVVVSSLLFALLFGLAFIAQGMIDAGKQVSDVGFNSRYLTSVYPLQGDGGADYNRIVKQVENQLDAELKKRKIKVTKELKLETSYATERDRRVAKKFGQNMAAALKKVESRLHTMAKPTAVYHFTPIPLSQFAQHQADPSIDPLVETLKKEQKGGNPSKGGYNPFDAGDLEFFTAEQDMFRTQLAKGQTFAWQRGDPYPLIVSYAYLEKLGDRPLANLPPVERNQGYKELIAQFEGKELIYCFRNSTALEQLHAVMAYNTTIEADDLASTKPLPLPVCAGFNQAQLKKLGIISDADPTGAKPLFPQPKIPAPNVTHLRFKIVGFVPSAQQFGSTDVITQVLTSISSLPTGPYPGVIPAEVAKADPILKHATGDEAGFNYANIFVDFKTRADQKAFVKQGCAGFNCSQKDAMLITPFGNITAALEGLFEFVSKVLFIAAIVIMVIAGLMIMFTISKVIADSTKEIAVFRSLGARRRDIAQIYYTYGFMLAGSALAVAVIVAVAGALLLTTLYDDKIAQGLIQATGAFNEDVSVVLLGINTYWVAGIIGALFLAAALGIAVPVLASIRRKLINILREE